MIPDERRQFGRADIAFGSDHLQKFDEFSCSHVLTVMLGVPENVPHFEAYCWRHEHRNVKNCTFF